MGYVCPPPVSAVCCVRFNMHQCISLPLYPSICPSCSWGSRLPRALPFFTFPRRVVEYSVCSALHLLGWNTDTQAPSAWKWRPDPSNCPLAVSSLPRHCGLLSSGGSGSTCVIACCSPGPFLHPPAYAYAGSLSPCCCHPLFIDEAQERFSL